MEEYIQKKTLHQIQKERIHLLQDFGVVITPVIRKHIYSTSSEREIEIYVHDIWDRSLEQCNVTALNKDKLVAKMGVRSNGTN